MTRSDVEAEASSATPALLTGKRVLVTGVLNRRSIALSIARAAQEQGAHVLVTSFGETRRHTERAVAELPQTPEVIELDATDPVSAKAAAGQAADVLGGLDGLVHSVAFGSELVLGEEFVAAPPSDVSEAFLASAHSLALLANAFRPLLRDGGGSIVGLTFESRYAWPSYSWMGVTKSALEAAGRYAANELGPEGIRVNLISAGPLRTLASRAIPRFGEVLEAWDESAPLGWDIRDPSAVADACCFLLSDLSRATTGEILHVDGGMHAVAPGSATGS